MSSFVNVTQRELQVLGCLARGMRSPQVAEELGISVETVKTHLRLVRPKLGARNSTHAVAIAWRAGMID